MSIKLEEKEHSASEALLWTYLGIVVKIICQFGIGITIARLLGPEPYGLVATSTIVISLCGLIADGGISAALIHHQDTSIREIAGAFWLQFFIATTICLLIILAAPVFVQWLNAPKAKLILQVSALGFPLNAIVSISMALLRRRLNMRIIQIAMICSYLGAYGGVGLILALNGFGVWALVYAQLAQFGINAVILYWAVRPPLSHPVWPQRLIGFGGWTVLTNITAWGHGNLMNIILTRSFGVIPLGQFNRLALISQTTVSIIGSPLQQVLFPAISRSANDPQRCREIVRAALRLVGLMFFPAMFIMFVFPDQMVAGIFGEKFSGNSEMLRPLALATIGGIWIPTVGSILSGRGKPKVQWFVQLSTLPAAVLILFYFSHATPVVLCWGFALNIWIRASANLFAALKADVLTLADVFSGFAPALLPSLAGLGCAWSGFHFSENLAPELSVLVAGGLALIGWMICILIFWQRIVPAQVGLRVITICRKAGFFIRSENMGKNK